jgi:large subunit ribosomal protein L7/L12
MAIERADVINYIKNLTVIELSELVKELEAVLGVSAAAPVAVAAGPVGGPAAAAAPAAEKTEFVVELTESGNNKIQVIKVIREITGLGLKEAKDFVEGAPKVIKDAAAKDEANSIKEKVEAVGAKVTIK